jgi:hypothetical protein
MSILEVSVREVGLHDPRRRHVTLCAPDGAVWEPAVRVARRGVLFSVMIDVQCGRSSRYAG